MNSQTKFALALVAGAMFGGATVEMLHAQQQGYHRTELYRADLTGTPNTEVIMGLSEYDPGSTIPRHFHYGDEFTYVMQGATLEAPGQSAPIVVKTGGVIHNKREVPHGGVTVTGDTALKLLTVHIVDKGKPLNELVPANQATTTKQ